MMTPVYSFLFLNAAVISLSAVMYDWSTFQPDPRSIIAGLNVGFMTAAVYLLFMTLYKKLSKKVKL